MQVIIVGPITILLGIILIFLMPGRRGMFRMRGTSASGPIGYLLILAGAVISLIEMGIWYF